MNEQQTMELRWWIGESNRPVLEYRWRPFVTDASGAFCGLGEWSEWTPVQGFCGEPGVVKTMRIKS